ncbi:transposase [Neisseria dentiae]|uniref:transposase n=1 Tax=Neisseria dentiae TaxID=194197 RepID=UPI00211C7562|nr:transposase [Neisseria dentiae]MCQ9325623.1 transposase [Neisseria dentiae]
MMELKYFIGIDVSKAKLDAAWLKDVQAYRYRSKVLGNNPKGCLQLFDWIRKNITTDLAEIGSAPDEVVLSIRQIQTAISDSMAELQRDIDEHIDRHPDLKHDIELLKTIPGVGDAVAPRMALLYRSRPFRSAAQMAAFPGLVPKERTSGQYRGKVRLSKQGNSKFRALLYMPAVVAKGCNPDIRACCERLPARGKSKMQAIGAVMRRLVHICFGVLKHQTVYQARTVNF